MNELMFTNEKLGIQVRTRLNDDGSICMNAEDVARGFGWVRNENKNGKEYESIMWHRMNSYCEEIGFAHKCAKEDYIPESLFYRLGMKANNETAQKFQGWLADEVIPEIRKTGSYSTKSMTETEKVMLEMDIVERAAKILNMNDNSKLACINNVLTNHNIPTNILPQYTESKCQLLPATELLKRNNVSVSTVKFNKLMLNCGYLENLSRVSKTKDLKIFKSLTSKGLVYGENQISPKNPKETQPLYYVDKFNELLHKINLL